jgi:hypothetical protein
MANGKEVSDRLRKGRSGGIPWIVILDPEGNELATSDGPQGNIGCPVKPDEVGHFMTMVEKSNKTYSPSEVQQLASALEIFAKKFRRN